MRNSLLASLALVCGAFLGLVSLGAKAGPIHVGLQNAAGGTTWTSPPFGDPSYLTLSGWASDGKGGWVPAYMTNGQDGAGNPGLGVCGVALNPDNTCPAPGETNEIDSDPTSQLIDMDISELHSDWTQVTVTLLSVEDLSNVTLTAATCSLVSAYAGQCQPATTSLPVNANYCSNSHGGIYSCTYTESYLDGLFQGLGAMDIWIEPVSQACVGSCANANFLLGSGLENGFIMDGTPAPVPEPSAFWMFGFGVLLLGLFVGLRRRRQTA